MEPEDNAGLGSPNSTPEENTGLQSSRDSAIEFEDDIYDIAPPGHMASDEDLDLEGNIYTKQPPEEVEMDGEVYEISGEGHMPNDDDLELEGTVYSPVEKPEEPPMTKEARLKQISESLAELVNDDEEETEEAGTSDGAKKAWQTRQRGGGGSKPMSRDKYETSLWKGKLHNRKHASPTSDATGRAANMSDRDFDSNIGSGVRGSALWNKGGKQEPVRGQNHTTSKYENDIGAMTHDGQLKNPYNTRSRSPVKEAQLKKIWESMAKLVTENEDYDEMEDDEYADEEVSGPPADSYMPATNLLKTEESIIIKGKNGFYKKPVYKKKV